MQAVRQCNSATVRRAHTPQTRLRTDMWLSQVDTLSSKQTPDARKTRFSLFGFNLTQARAADDELWCVYDPVFDLFLPCEPAA